jgi:hypothetical protein
MLRCRTGGRLHGAETHLILVRRAVYLRKKGFGRVNAEGLSGLGLMFSSDASCASSEGRGA